jgi:hypothetical protein
MNAVNRRICEVMVFSVGVLMAVMANAAAIPSGWTCNGGSASCGTSGADGVVTLPPNGSSSYQWASTNTGLSGVGALPTGKLGAETNGATLATSVFSANSGAALSFYFNFVTSDGSGFADYGWAALFDSSNTLSALLFTARTAPSGSIVPGFGMPSVNAALTPASVPIIPGDSHWSPLGSDSGSCYNGPAAGCGYTGWVNASYTIATAGNYYLAIGVTNWTDNAFQTGLAMSGVTVDGNPIIDTPEPAAIGVFALGLLMIGAVASRRRRVG